MQNLTLFASVNNVFLHGEKLFLQCKKSGVTARVFNDFAVVGQAARGDQLNLST